MAEPISGTRTDGRGELRVLLVVEHAELRAELQAVLATLSDPKIEIVEAEPGLATNGNGPPAADVEMVVFDSEKDALNLIRTRSAEPRRPALFALLPERSHDLMRRVLRAGADEVLFLPLDAGDATRALLKVSEARWRSDRSGQGVICSVASMAGGMGVTTLASNLALALRHSLDMRVAAVDLDLQRGGLAPMLNLEPERTISDLLADSSKKLDSVQLELALSKYPSGIYVLAAPKRIEDSEAVTDSLVGAALDLMRQLFDYVIVDCGTQMSEVTLAAWERSEHLYYVVAQTLGSIRGALRFLELFQRLHVAVEPQFILNRFASQHPISEDQVSRSIGHPIYAKIPKDETNAERVTWSAGDLWQLAPRSPMVQSFEELAAKLANRQAEIQPPQRNSIVARLLGAIGRDQTES